MRFSIAQQLRRTAEQLIRTILLTRQWIAVHESGRERYFEVQERTAHGFLILRTDSHLPVDRQEFVPADRVVAVVHC